MQEFAPTNCFLCGNGFQFPLFHALLFSSNANLSRGAQFHTKASIESTLLQNNSTNSFFMCGFLNSSKGEEETQKLWYGADKSIPRIAEDSWVMALAAKVKRSFRNLLSGYTIM